MRKLDKEVSKVPGVIADCVVFDYAYNTNELLFADFLEAGIQKVEEQKRSTSDFWRQYFRLLPLLSTDPVFVLLVDFYLDTDAAVNLGRFVLGDQVDEHLAKYRTYLAQGKRVVLVPHSQGNLYANEEWDKLTVAEKNVTDIVAVATPAGLVAKNGPYTTLAEDGIAKFLFPLALPANATNEEPCADDWTCHGFKESYLHGVHSRTRIVKEIVALLPVVQKHCVIEGVLKDWDNVTIISNGVVSLLDGLTGGLVAKTASDSIGQYCLENVTNGSYFIEASKNGLSFGGRDVKIYLATPRPIRINFPIASQM